MVGTFGLRALSDLAEAIELACREGRPADVQALATHHLLARQDEADAFLHRWQQGGD